MPRSIYAVEQAEVLWRRGAELHVRFTMKLPRPIGRVSWTNAITHRCEAECSRIEWSLVGGDLRANEGWIELRPIAEAGQLATQVDYAAAISTRLGLPRVVERAVARWLLPRVLERLRGALPPSSPRRKSPAARAAGQPRLRGRFESSNTSIQETSVLSPLAPSIRSRRACSESSVRLAPRAATDARRERREPELRGRE